MIDINKKDCVGCYACSSICPKNCIFMKSDKEGFEYPEVNEDRCVKCGLCINVCPIINKKSVQNEPAAYACINNDESIRMKSSSGGVFTLISEQVIYDGGVVFGAGFDGNFGVSHSFIEKKDDIEKFRGSKYVQSKIGDTYQQAKKFIEQGRKVLFTGTPCQIAGLQSYLRQPYDNLFCIDIVCHGVPSQKVWQKYISYRENCAASKTKSINFRDKEEGWNKFCMLFLFENNTEYRLTYGKDLYMSAYLNDLFIRPSCYSCNFKTLNRQSDITLADFWGVRRLLPEMFDNKGTSLVFVNNSKGQSMLEQIKNKMLCEISDINQAVSYNAAATKTPDYHPNRDDFFNNIETETFDQLVSKYFINKS